MKKLAFLLPLFALAACGEEPAPAPAETAAPALEVASLPSPNEEYFTKFFAANCPAAEPVSTAVCKRAGLGSDDIVCEFGLGEDEVLRHETTLTAADGDWALVNADAICAEHDSHHVDP